jgi:hypothetical protein
MTTELDPKGLIADSYVIEGISAPECRSIFLDWALSLPEGVAQGAAIEAQLARYGADAPDHPMTAVLREGLGSAPPPRRRGGRSGRVG